jgi:hypothetical protein
MKRKTVNSKGELNLDLEPVAGKFAMAVRDGAAREIACFGTRGDGKTFAALVAMIMHSVAHKAVGRAQGAAAHFHATPAVTRSG